MTTSTAASVVGDLRTLIPDYERSMRAANKAPRTIQIYGDSARWLEQFLAINGMPTQVAHLRREHVEAFVDDQLQRWPLPASATGH